MTILKKRFLKLIRIFHKKKFNNFLLVLDILEINFKGLDQNKKQIKTRMIEVLILALPNFEILLVVEYDASYIRIGTIFSTCLVVWLGGIFFFSNCTVQELLI